MIGQIRCLWNRGNFWCILFCFYFCSYCSFRGLFTQALGERICITDFSQVEHIGHVLFELLILENTICGRLMPNSCFDRSSLSAR